MESSTTNLNNNTKKKKILTTLSSYLPTNERTWNYAIPTFGFSLSCFAFGMFISALQDLKRQEIVSHEMYNFGYLILAAASAIELYYGLTHRSRRQFTFWLFLKFIELLLLVDTIVMEFISRDAQYDLGAGGIVIFTLDILLVSYVAKRSTKRQRKNVENIYEVPSENHYANVNVY